MKKEIEKTGQVKRGRKPGKVKAEKKPATNRDKKKPEESKPESEGTKKKTACLLMARTQAFEHSFEYSHEYQWHVGRLMARKMNLGQAIEFGIVNIDDAQESAKELLSAILKIIRINRTGGILINSVVFASPDRVSRSIGSIMYVRQRLTEKGITLVFCEDFVFPKHLRSLRQAMLHTNEGYDLALQEWAKSETLN